MDSVSLMLTIRKCPGDKSSSPLVTEQDERLYPLPLQHVTGILEARGARTA
jgi:hypothetical protein